MKFISPRVSIDRDADRFSVVISPRLSPLNRTLLVTWVVAWTFCGVYVLYEWIGMSSSDPVRQYLLAFLAFWAYFEFTVLRVMLWRLKGFEIWRIKGDRFTIKNSILGFGKAHDHFIQNIQELGLIEVDRTSWKWQMNESAWVMGGERIGFEHLGKKVVFGKGLTIDEARQILPILKQALTEARKRTDQ